MGYLQLPEAQTHPFSSLTAFLWKGLCELSSDDGVGQQQHHENALFDFNPANKRQ